MFLAVPPNALKQGFYSIVLSFIFLSISQLLLERVKVVESTTARLTEYFGRVEIKLMVKNIIGWFNFGF